MPLPVLTAATQANCPHQLPVTFAATAVKVLVAGSPALADGDQAIVGPTCPFTVPTGKLQPCVVATLQLKAATVTSGGRALVLQSPADLCESAEKIPQGPVVYVNVQTKVLAS